jgi:hypothetical protein
MLNSVNKQMTKILYANSLARLMSTSIILKKMQLPKDINYNDFVFVIGAVLCLIACR